MIKLFNIANLRRNIFVFLGLFVAIFIVSQEVIEYQCNLICQQLIEESEDDADNDEESLTFTISSNALIPVFGVELEPFQLVFIAQVINDVEVEIPGVEEVALYNSPHFKTLFRQIQSPNAP